MRRSSMAVLALSLGLTLSVLVALLTNDCGGGEGSSPPEIVQAANVVRWLLKKPNLSRSMFSAAFQYGTPSQFVSYYFSDMGVAEWPPSEETATPMEREQMEAIRAPMLPKGVAFVATRPDASRGKQLVIGADDANGTVVVYGFTDPSQAPVLVRKMKLPKVTPSPVAELLFRSNLETGMSFQAF